MTGGGGVSNILSGICSQFPPGDPGADKLLFWNNTLKQFDYLGIGEGLTIVGGDLISDGAGGGELIAADMDMTLIASDSGNIYSNAGALGLVTVTLDATSGFTAGFVVAEAFEFRIKAPTGTIIYDGNNASADGGYDSSARIGSWLEVYCIDTETIVVRNAKGAWGLN